MHKSPVKFVEFLAGVGLLIYGFDPLYAFGMEQVLGTTTNPADIIVASTPANLELLYIGLFGIGIILFIHATWSIVKVTRR
jgi:hypothetical protein